MKRITLTIISTVILTVGIATLPAAPVVIDDFNVNEGHFSSVPTASGSTAGILASSTADRVTTIPVEGAGCERLVFNTNGAATVRVRFLSGGGTIANNTPIATSGNVDGWIGFYLKTTNTGWNVQLWLEGGPGGQAQSATNNGSVPKDLIADGEWHLYEWDLDNTAGDADGWGSVANIINGSSTILDGNHTIDSIIFRNSAAPNSITNGVNVIFLDFLARNDAGSVSNLLLTPCISTTGVLPIGPVSTDVNQVIVAGVSATATEVKVYQNTGPGDTMVAIGSKNTGITAGNNTVTVSGLVKAAQVVATQTVNGQESCVQSSGLIVGGGANPSIRASLSIRETTSTGPIGDPGESGSTSLHFLGATAVSGGAPLNGQIIYPSNDWQTVTFFRGTNVSLGDAANATGAVAEGVGYNPTDGVSLQVFAYRSLPNGSTIFSTSPAEVLNVTSNDVFTVNWTWDAVPDADGYRLLRNYNSAGYIEYQDVTSNSFSDVNLGWAFGDTVTPKSSKSGRSIQWNPSVTNLNNLPGQWGIFESLAFGIDAGDNTGPFDLYIDNIQNGTNIFQTFELAPANSTDYGFRAPSFSGTTVGNLLTAPDVGQVSNQAADTGAKSFHVRFQWKGTNSTSWLRLTTSGVNNPQINLEEPISFRLLMQPVGAIPPTPPAAPTLTVNQFGDKTVLNWTGGHRLQTAVNASGTYTNVPQVISANTWTNITSGAFLSPWTNNYTQPARFFRLVD